MPVIVPLTIGVEARRGTKRIAGLRSTVKEERRGTKGRNKRRTHDGRQEDERKGRGGVEMNERSQPCINK